MVHNYTLLVIDSLLETFDLSETFDFHSQSKRQLYIIYIIERERVNQYAKNFEKGEKVSE